MKSWMSSIAICVALSGCSDDGPWSGPAGTKMGISKEQLGKYSVLESVGSNNIGTTMFSSKQAPSMTSAADTYEYVFSPEGQLCMVQMRFESVRQTASPLMLDLKTRYGLPAKDPAVSWGVVWSSEKYKLSDNLSEISAEFQGEEPNVSAVVSFSFENVKDCKPQS
ncbi:hypothetical protein [Pseudomonas paraversuta]|uniref:hypothetical protein n=1 Tax=Pseudomonas paraversuta TaxID=2750624 RepID=UPI001931696E|nr:hypothetical protein [Pseudomonas paraversuta]